MQDLVLQEYSSQEKNELYSQEELSRLDPSAIPSHVAIVMDGNRRWAVREGLSPIMGHWKGAETLTQITRAASCLGIKTLTVYSFSTENWGRSSEEVDALMHLFKIYLQQQREPMKREGVRLRAIGDLGKLPPDVFQELALSQSYTEECKKIDLVLAINYGGRDDIRRAFVSIVEEIERGKLTKAHISEKLIGSYLDTALWPDPALFIRTSGEKRQSNFLLWQLCYSEFYYTNVLWPDFQPKDLLDALCECQSRKRRLGE